MRITSLPLLLLAAAGCPRGAPEDSALGPVDSALPCGEPPTVTLGGGVSAFEPLADGDPIEIVHGPQGGWHVHGSARTEGLTPIVSIVFQVERASDGARVSDNRYDVLQAPYGECGGEYPGMFGFLSVDSIADGERDTPPELLHGEGLRLRLVVTDDAGVTVQDEVTGVGYDPEVAGG